MHLPLADVYLHAIDPFAIRITDTFGVRWYGLSYVVGFVLAWLIIRWFAVTGRSPLSPPAVADLMFYVIIGVLVGGRLGYVLFYDPSLLVHFTSQVPFWGVLAINKGGMASHGGMLGVILAVWLFAHRRGLSSLHLLDIGAVGCTPGLFFGRLANFVNAELWGRPLAEAQQASPPWWSVKYPQQLNHLSPEQLATLREAVGEVGVSPGEWDHAIAQLAIDPESPPREVAAFVYRRIGDLIEAVQAGNEVVIEAVRPLLTAYYPSQIFQAITDGPVLLLVLVLVWLRPRNPGIVGSAFLITYGLLRITTEVFRQPDEGVALLMGLSRGQVLSVLMVVAGVIGLIICARRDVDPMGGLLRRP